VGSGRGSGFEVVGLTLGVWLEGPPKTCALRYVESSETTKVLVLFGNSISRRFGGMISRSHALQ
jgi:hypothetical protein